MKTDGPSDYPFLLHPNQTATWHALINEAQVGANIQLPVDLESYLVFLLIRFTRKSSLSGSVLGLEYLEEISKTHSTCGLQTVGDKCLLYAGLFPEHAHKRSLHPSYFVQLGQSAYITLAHQEQDRHSLFHTLSEGFILMKDVLLASRTSSKTSSSSQSSLYTYQPTSSNGTTDESITSLGSLHKPMH